MSYSVDSCAVSEKIFIFLKKQKKASITELMKISGETRIKVQSIISSLRVSSENGDYTIISDYETKGDVVYEYVLKEDAKPQRSERLLKSVFC